MPDYCFEGLFFLVYFDCLSILFFIFTMGHVSLSSCGKYKLKMILNRKKIDYDDICVSVVGNGIKIATTEINSNSNNNISMPNEMTGRKKRNDDHQQNR